MYLVPWVKWRQYKFDMRLIDKKYPNSIGYWRRESKILWSMISKKTF